MRRDSPDASKAEHEVVLFKTSSNTCGEGADGKVIQVD
jgi:hypothetical protein